MIDTFNPILRAQHDPSEYIEYSHWLKPVLYNVPAGQRFVKFVEGLSQTILRDAAAAEWAPLLYRVLGLEEGQFSDLERLVFDQNMFVIRPLVTSRRGRWLIFIPGSALGSKDVTGHWRLPTWKQWWKRRLTGAHPAS